MYRRVCLHILIGPKIGIMLVLDLRNKFIRCGNSSPSLVEGDDAHLDYDHEFFFEIFCANIFCQILNIFVQIAKQNQE